MVCSRSWSVTHTRGGLRRAGAEGAPPPGGEDSAPCPHRRRITGRFVAIGNGRTLYMECVGSGSPAVVLEAGFGADSHSWQDVQPEVGRGTRTCSYDRAGTGNSVAPPGVRDARDEIADLRRLHARARVEPPYVLVGHSYGGVLSRVFAHLYPSETAGLVLIDTTGRDGRRRQLAIWPRSQAREIRRGLATAVMEGVDLAAGEAIASRVTSLGGLPLRHHHSRTRGQLPAHAGTAAPRLETAVGPDAGRARRAVREQRARRCACQQSRGASRPASRPSSSARCRPLSAPPATTRVFRRAGVCSAVPTSAAAVSRDERTALALSPDSSSVISAGRAASIELRQSPADRLSRFRASTIRCCLSPN